MKVKRLIPLLMVLPLMAGCGGDPVPDPDPKPSDLVIPTIDVDSIVPDLPAKPTYSGDIKTDDTYDYIDFYELSDTHGAVNEESDKIGLAKLASYLKLKRDENPGGTVVVSSGDMFQGSAESNLTHGYMVNYAMNYMGFDSMAIGNHEFDWTDAWLKKNANLSYEGHKIPYISANIVDKTTNDTPDFISKSTIVERGGYKIGIVGSVGDNLKGTILASCVENYDFTKEVTAVNAEAAKLKETDHCDIVLLTSHNDIANLDGVGLENVDAIFGGHAHEDKQLNINNTIPAVQTENYGKSVAHIQLKIEKSSKTVSTSVRELDDEPLKLAGLTANQDVVRIMSKYNTEIDKVKNIKLGKSDSLLKENGALKGLCVEGMYQGALAGIKNLNLNIAESDILATFHNVNGGIRASINEGDITLGDVFKPFPFDNEVVLYKVNGATFKSKAAKYPDYAVRRTFDKKDEIDSSKDYYIVLTDFIALSPNYFKDVFDIKEADLIRTGKVVRDEVANVIYKKENIVGSEFNNVYPYKQIPKIF